MVSPVQNSLTAVIVDANVIIAICARETDKYATAEAKLVEYANRGCQFFAPGAVVMECLFVFCKKLKDGVLSDLEHSAAVSSFVTLMANINPPPSGDKSLIVRAEAIRDGLGCSRSADGIYLALAEEIGKSYQTEVLTFDSGMRSQAVANSLLQPVIVLPIT